MTTLTNVVGVSTIFAARLLGEGRRPPPVPDASAFAASNGSAPLDAHLVARLARYRSHFGRLFVAASAC